MEIGVGLPTTVPGLTGPKLLTWARQAEEHGFASLGVLDRLVYDNYESLVALAAAGAVTSRIRLAATILIAPYRDSAALLAKQAATVDAVSGGRLVLGLAAGGRPDDYETSGADYAGRGRRLDAIVGELRSVWAEGSPVGPRPVSPGGPRLLFGGHSPVAMRRAARYGEGWIAGGSSVAGFAALGAQAREIWAAQGREGRPRLLSLAYVSLGPEGREQAERYLRSYYAFIGPKAERAAAGVLTTPEAVRATIRDYAAAGCDELILLPCSPDDKQLRLIAEAAL
ncbi:F420-dependent glucose-6-phosphate dehydrogenase [Streptomyces sp. RB5]|uniref:F420-dependent glucose-6-phosphate dehydrogenase n=1 Tax=Streptomyces smaragdinus TaxID=2585196 RepID=A0A7K0CE36_9ACTN|nr:LLM class flavin-dependent oxidoreductase [Streptomyces smaragdinus]MQY11603.1 F420-dependent glucose-6-phosphate dehydrogenase [Streptomyces smaragdinus]